MKKYFITATGTEIGKTLVTSALCHQLMQAGNTVRPLKPVISGWEEGEETDTACLLRSSGQSLSPENIDSCSPWRFIEPLSPDMAARRESREIHLQELVRFCRAQEAGEQQYLFVEGVGGVMVPLNDRHTVLDWMKALQYPVLLVTGSYLGTLSHTLTALSTLQSARLSVAGIIVSASEVSPVPVEETIQTLKNFLPSEINIIAISRLKIGRDNWKRVPDLTGLLT